LLLPLAAARWRRLRAKNHHLQAREPPAAAAYVM
jgi:hypothetical protein